MGKSKKQLVEPMQKNGPKQNTWQTKALHSPNSLVGLQLPVMVYSTRVYSCRWQWAIENNPQQAHSHKASWLTFLLTAQILSHSIMTTERDEPCTHHQHFRQD